ncbi:NAD(P)-binding protein [Lepidopterella palustris CBS 459.81]|uniref:NAD(P)-binding protein n=1 Tax=Lepidopterella palustris CBS 459.81 TaxID=1314670 RepID=A0A8E2JFQ3_9PEZI|nr:NAD(P)-binding protein [Lepidopterella palustris CBS 459.81]
MTTIFSIDSRSVAILGAGTQGRRLAFMWSSQGGTVNLIDVNPQQLQESRAYISGLIKASSSNHKRGEIRLFLATELEQACKNAWLIVECVPEKLALKRKTVVELDKCAPLGTIIASNSSSYTIDDIIDGLELKEPARTLSAHSYWPPETPAIEIMASKHTQPDFIKVMMEQCRSHGFSPYHVRNGSTGYIYNRIWAAIKRETLLALSEGVASPAEIDGIFKDVLKTPKGPCELMDVVGLDVVLDIEEHYAYKRIGIPEEPRELLREMVGKDLLGVKSGKGFYEYR